MNKKDFVNCQYVRYYVWDFHERVDRSDVPRLQTSHPNIFAQATAFPQPIGALSQFLRLPSPRLPRMSICSKSPCLLCP